MHLSLTATFGLLGLAARALAAPTAAAEESAADTLTALNQRAIEILQARHQGDLKAKRGDNGCSFSNAAVRKDWSALSNDERKDYISAVKCLIDTPSKADPAFAPGAKTRYDDFVAVHINQTLEIHGTANFLTWHRYFTWAYETALRDECGYKGYQPYWNWFDGLDFKTSPLFDGSDTSMSGDGEYVAHNGSLSGSNNIYIPSGNGGGCIKDGPFKGVMANLGPITPGMDGMTPSSSALAYNPRCLRRDLSAYPHDNWMTTSSLLNLTVGDATQSIEVWQNELQGRFADGYLGVHAAGHFTMGGDSADIFASINDPVFFHHHSMVDRMYWLWQIYHPEQARDISGTITILNTPPSRSALKTDALNMGVNAPMIKIDDALDTFKGPFCYMYE